MDCGIAAKDRVKPRPALSGLIQGDWHGGSRWLRSSLASADFVFRLWILRMNQDIEAIRQLTADWRTGWLAGKEEFQQD